MGRTTCRRQRALIHYLQIHAAEVSRVSRKNHQMIEGSLIQTDKRFSQLKQRQKEKINENQRMAVSGIFCPVPKIGKVPDSRHNDKILFAIQEKIEEAGIWIPLNEVEKYFFTP